MAKFYIWFVIVIAGVAGAIRVLLPRRFAELQAQRLQSKPVSRERLKALLFFMVGIIFGGMYFLPWGHQGWIAIGVVFSFLSAAECFFQAKYSSLDDLTFQSRLLGILYLGLCAGSCVMLTRQ